MKYALIIYLLLNYIINKTFRSKINIFKLIKKQKK